MAKHNSDTNPEVVPVDAVQESVQQFTNMTDDQRMTAMFAMFQKMTAESNKALADAIIESRKPYEDPKVAENDKIFRENDRQTEARKKAGIKQEQDYCTHIAGSNQLSEYPDERNRTAILWHQFDDGAERGICLVCQRVFEERDEDFGVWRQKVSICRRSAAGQRRWVGGMAAGRR